jgi:hypothetical protein
MTFKKSHFLIWRFLLLCFCSSLRSPIIDILKFNGLRHKHLRLELELVRVQETELQLLTKLDFLFKIRSHYLLLLNNFSCELRRLMLRWNHVVNVVILVFPMQMISYDCLTPSDYQTLRSRSDLRLHL